MAKICIWNIYIIITYLVSNTIVLLNGYFHNKPALCPRQSYWVMVSCICSRQRRGPIQLIEAQYDCTRT